MISIIICSRHKIVNKKLKLNIDKTIGNIPYEIICIDNSQKKHSIFSAYNEGVQKANYDYLCFMHEDIHFHSDNWGGLLINNLKDSEIGIVGTMGGYYIDQYSIYWTIQTLMRGSLVHTEPSFTINKCNEHEELGNFVVAVDGLWMGIRKSMFDKVLKWDTDTYDGFHFYDMDISLQAFTQGYKIKIIDEIFIEHNTLGIINDTFYKNCIKFHEKWDSYMPLMSINIPSQYIQEARFIQLKKACSYELFFHKTKKMLSKFPYKVVTKIYKLLQKIDE